MANLQEFIRNHPVIVFLGALASGFIFGTACYEGLLQITNQETVIKNTYILKKDIVHNILKKEAIREIDHLIQNGRKLKDKSEMNIWLMRVLTFTQVLGLEKDRTYKEQKMSAVEANVRWVFDRNPSIETQSQQVLGILEGLKSGFEPQINPS